MTQKKKTKKSGSNSIFKAVAGAIIGTGVAVAGTMFMKDKKNRDKVNKVLTKAKKQTTDYIKKVEKKVKKEETVIVKKPIKKVNKKITKTVKK